MKIGKPSYFSPDFHHRIITVGDELMLNSTLTNQNLCTLAKSDEIMWQVQGTHPMVYFHNNDQVVILTKYGVEKVIEIQRT